MTTIRHCSPLSRVAARRGAIDHLFEDFLGDFFSSGKETTRELSFYPPVNIKEDKDAIFVSVEIPGVSKKEINIELNDNQLTISGERKLENEEKDEMVHRVERTYGSFTRSFTLPYPVEREKIEAALKDGILELTLPKREEAKPRKIAIKG